MKFEIDFGWEGVLLEIEFEIEFASDEVRWRSSVIDAERRYFG